MINCPCTLSVFIILLVLTERINGNAKGPPLSVCENFEPLHNASNTFDLDYRIISSKDTFVAGETIDITLGFPSYSFFKGLIMQVREGNTEKATGRFTIPQSYPYANGLQLLNCPNGNVNSTVGHSNADPKTSPTFEWQAPDSCNGEHNYTVKATVVQSLTLYQMDVTKVLKCVQNPVCQYSNLTSLPKNNKYKTSFESESDKFNGWINYNSTWTRRTGKTPSRKTGPKSANKENNSNNRYYIYHEASDREKKISVLKSDTDLIGCFCLEFQKHANIRNVTGHTISVFVGSKMAYSSEFKENYWKDVKVQVDISQFTSIKIVVNRGNNFQGDIAIDDIKLEKGECN